MEAKGKRKKQHTIPNEGEVSEERNAWVERCHQGIQIRSHAGSHGRPNKYLPYLRYAIPPNNKKKKFTHYIHSTKNNSQLSWICAIPPIQHELQLLPTMVGFKNAPNLNPAPTIPRTVSRNRSSGWLKVGWTIISSLSSVRWIRTAMWKGIFKFPTSCWKLRSRKQGMQGYNVHHRIRKHVALTEWDYS